MSNWTYTAAGTAGAVGAASNGAAPTAWRGRHSRNGSGGIIPTAFAVESGTEWAHTTWPYSGGSGYIEAVVTNLPGGAWTSQMALWIETASNGGYCARIDPYGGIQFVRYTNPPAPINGSWTPPINTGGGTVKPGDTVRLAATQNGSATTFTVSVNGAAVGTVTDNTPVHGTHAGISNSADITVTGRTHGVWGNLTMSDPGGTTETPLGTPTLTATVVDSTRIDVNWTAVTGAASYKLDIDGTVQPLAGTVLAFQHTGLQAQSSHTYKLQAVSPSGATSAWSTAVTAQTPAAPVVNPPNPTPNPSSEMVVSGEQDPDGWIMLSATGLAHYNFSSARISAGTGTGG